MAEFGLEDHVVELNRTAAAIARRAADDYTKRDPDKPRFVAGSIGPTNKSLSLGVNVEDPGHRDVTFDQMVANYKEQVRALIDGGRRHPPARDLVRHARHEGVPVRHRPGLRGDGHAGCR